MHASVSTRLTIPDTSTADAFPGASGTVKLAKKEAKPASASPTAKKAEPKLEKKTTEKKAAAAPKKATTTVCLPLSDARYYC